MRGLKKSVYWLVFCGLLAYVSACEESPEEQYKKWEQTELARGVRYDSLFKGIHLAMGDKEFYDHCFQMNLRGEFHQGGVRKSTWVECKLPSELRYPAAINFFPTFEEQRITQMEASIYYDSAPDRVVETDSLLTDVKQLLERWYGPGFIRIKSPYFYKDDVWVKVDGNRRVTVYEDPSGHMVNIWYVDLLAKKEEDESSS